MKRMTKADLQNENEKLQQRIDELESGPNNRQLHDTDADLERMQRLVHVGLWNLDVGAGDLYWSDETFRIYGFRPQEFVPTFERFQTILHRDDYVRVQNAVDAALSGTADYVIDFRFLRPSGEVGWIHCDGEVTRDPDGKPVRFFGTQMDITERKKDEEALKARNQQLAAAEQQLWATNQQLEANNQQLRAHSEALRDSEEKFRTLVTNAEEIVYMIGKDGTFLLSEGRGLGKLGLEPGQVVGASIYELYKDFPEMLDAMEKAFRGERVTADVNVGGIHYSSWYSPYRDEQGEVAGLLGLSVDITNLKRTQSDLIASENQLQNIFDSTTDAILVFSMDGTIERANPAAAQMHGYKKDELVGTNVRDLVHPESIAIFGQGMESISKGQPYAAVARDVRKDGSQFDIEVRITPLLLDGKPHVLGVLQDITSRLEAEATLRRSAEKFRNLVENISEVFYILSLDGVPEYTSPAIEQVLGYTPQELEQGGIWRHLHPDDVQRARASFEKVMREGSSSDEYRVRMKSGEYRWIQVSNRARYDGQQPIGMQGVMADITERKLAEEKLHQSDVIVASSADMLALLDRNYTYLHVNRHYVGAFGMKREQIVGQTVTQVFGEEFFTAVIHPHADRCMAGEDVRYEDWFDFPATGRKHMQITYDPYVGTDGDVLGFVVNGRDVTDRKVAEDALKEQQENLEILVRKRTAELETTNQELESFAYSISHDLRAPLRAIDGFSKAFLEDYGDRVDGVGQDQLNRVRAGAQRMGTLIDDLLRLSRLSRVDARNVEVDLTKLAQSIVDQLRSSDPERAVDVTIAPDLVAHGDPTLLESALQNLLSNAWKFGAQEAQAEIEVGSAKIDDVRTFFIRDNGAGFDMAYADKLFGVFQRLHDATEFPGTGVGLATVQRVIQRHGGRVWSEGAVGRGATFYFTLPTQVPEKGE